MHGDKLIEQSPMRALASEIRGGLNAGQVGGVLARAGIGKSAFLVQIAMTCALRGNPVLHVSLTDGQARVRSFYDELLAEVSRAASVQERSSAQVELERNRVIHASLGRSFGPGDLASLVSTLSEVMHFRPVTVVIDGSDVSHFDVDGWRSVAAALGLRLWMAVRTHRDEEAEVVHLADSFDSAVVLQPAAGSVELRILRVGGEAVERALLALDPVTMMVRSPGVEEGFTMPPSPHPEACTLYSGGAAGAEEAFGENAARYGVREVHFSFAGHTQARTEGRKELDARELAAGDVSLVYVAHRLHRHWDKTETLRKVLQTQWHVVSHATQIFLVGTIQPDGTVHGGTGWSVELAKRWNKRVWVFDQNHSGWFTWNGASWSRGEPVIQVPDFAGTGTRFLNDAGRQAIVDLFDRSFGSL